MRNSLEGEIFKAKAALEAQINDSREANIRHEQALRNCDEDLKAKNEEMRTMEKLLRDQLKTVEEEK